MNYCNFLRFGLLFVGLVLVQPVSATDATLEGYRPVDLASWEPRTAPSVMALVEPLYRDHPESLEGGPTLKIDLHPGDSGELIIELEMGGYLDDSVAGQQYRAIVVQSSGGWRLQALGTRYICARGSNAGKPTVNLCL